MIGSFIKLESVAAGSKMYKQGKAEFGGVELQAPMQ